MTPRKSKIGDQVREILDAGADPQITVDRLRKLLDEPAAAKIPTPTAEPAADDPADDQTPEPQPQTDPGPADDPEVDPDDPSFAPTS